MDCLAQECDGLHGGAALSTKQLCECSLHCIALVLLHAGRGVQDTHARALIKERKRDIGTREGDGGHFAADVGCACLEHLPPHGHVEEEILARDGCSSWAPRDSRCPKIEDLALSHGFGVCERRGALASDHI